MHSKKYSRHYFMVRSLFRSHWPPYLLHISFKLTGAQCMFSWFAFQPTWLLNFNCHFRRLENWQFCIFLFTFFTSRKDFLFLHLWCSGIFAANVLLLKKYISRLYAWAYIEHGFLPLIRSPKRIQYSKVFKDIQNNIYLIC